MIRPPLHPSFVRRGQSITNYGAFKLKVKELSQNSLRIKKPEPDALQHHLSDASSLFHSQFVIEPKVYSAIEPGNNSFIARLVKGGE